MIRTPQTHRLARGAVGPILLLFLLAIPSVVNAKGPPDLLTISGPGIVGVANGTNTRLLQSLGLGSFEEFANPIQRPTHLGDGYELTRYYKNNAGGFTPFDRLIYYPNPNGGADFVHYIGIVNGWSEYDGKWFRASPEGEQSIRSLIPTISNALICQGIEIGGGCELIQYSRTTRWLHLI